MTFLGKGYRFGKFQLEKFQIRKKIYLTLTFFSILIFLKVNIGQHLEPMKDLFNIR